MDPQKNTVKARIIRGVGDLQKVDRPRQLQHYAGTNEHHIVHELYLLKQQGIVDCKVRNNVHSAGKNLTSIKLTSKGKDLYRKMTSE
jgi:hypothetical protein